MCDTEDSVLTAEQVAWTKMGFFKQKHHWNSQTDLQFVFVLHFLFKILSKEVHMPVKTSGRQQILWITS